MWSSNPFSFWLSDLKQITELIIESLAWCSMLILTVMETKVYILQFRWFIRFGVLYVLVGDLVMINLLLSVRDYCSRLDFSSSKISNFTFWPIISFLAYFLLVLAISFFLYCFKIIMFWFLLKARNASWMWHQLLWSCSIILILFFTLADMLCICASAAFSARFELNCRIRLIVLVFAFMSSLNVKKWALEQSWQTSVTL